LWCIKIVSVALAINQKGRQTMHGTIPKPKKGLSLKTITALVQAAQPGMWTHERGLCLAISKTGSAFWALRYSTTTGQRRLMTLEPYEPIDAAKLKALEWTAADYRKQIKAGRDPLAERNATIKVAAAIIRAADTFEDVALDYIAQHKDGWKGHQHHDQWTKTLATYAYPIIGKMAPHEITTNDVLDVLRQKHGAGTFWTTTRETASRVRSRIEIVIGAAKAKGISDPNTRKLWDNHHNPARWEDNIQHWMNGKQSREHFAAMDWNDVPAFVKELQQKTGNSVKALMLTILCAVRTSETLNATWTEFDIDAATWTIPKERMKAGIEHRVPLSNAAIEILRSLHRIDGNPYVFPGYLRNKPMSYDAMLKVLRTMRDGLTVHGFRSAFRDWTSETTLHPDTVVEMALAHTIKDKTQRAYRRGDAFERRKDLMQQWNDYLLSDQETYRSTWEKLIA
jgi:integrase